MAEVTRIEKVLHALGIEGRRIGDEIQALCPYHHENNPSWSIKCRGPKAGVHWCFSCTSGGRLIDLVVHVRRIHYGLAKRWLDEIGAGEQTGPAQAPVVKLQAQELASRGFRLTPGVCIEPFDLWPTPPKRYAESRGLTSEQVYRWGIGYAVTGRLQGRLVLVVRDQQGRPRSYMARDFIGEGQRYLYPKAEERPDLDIIFGEQHWPERSRQKVVVTEGALDALAAERAGAQHIACLGGSHVRPIHLVKVSTFREVLILTDPDEAGERAAEDLRTKLGRGVSVQRIKLPQGKDANDMPNSLLRSLILATSTGT